ncbi:MAG: PAS domain-containing protein [Gemmatimonadales bacterium]|nr:PAS domain-containing protein [Gemmatimonadales bacterium]
MQDVTAIVQLTRRRRTAEHGESTAREEARLSAMQAETQARAEARLRRVCEQAPVAMCVLRGPEHVYEVANSRYLEIVGHRPIIGLSVREAFPEIAGQGIYELLDDTYTSGQRCYAHERPITVARGPGGALEEVFYDFVYEPLLDADGAIEGITAVVTDATERVRARAVVEQAEAEHERLTALERAAGQRAEAAEALLRRVYQQAPVAIAVLRGSEHRFEVANPRYVELVGKQVTPGRSVRQVFPELGGQGIFGYERRDTGPELRAVLYYQAGG